MQAPLAIVGLLLGLAARWPTGHIGWLLGELIMIANWPSMYLCHHAYKLLAHGN